jgi:hypothetical protein
MHARHQAEQKAHVDRVAVRNAAIANDHKAIIEEKLKVNVTGAMRKKDFQHVEMAERINQIRGALNRNVGAAAIEKAI